MTSYPAFLQGIDLFTLPRVRYEQREHLPELSAIYFVYHWCGDLSEFIFYIGETKNLRQRWRHHNKVKTFPFWLKKAFEIAWIEAPRDDNDRKRWESDAIDFFHPQFNQLPGPQPQQRRTDTLTDAQLQTILQQYEAWRQQRNLPRAHDRWRRKEIPPS